MKAEFALVMAALESGYQADRVHEVGKVPPLPTTPYLDVAVSLGSPINYRASGTTPSRAYRAVVRAFGKSVNEVSFAAEKAESALLHKRIAPGYSRCRREVSAVVDDPRGGDLLMVIQTYTFHKTA